MVKTGLGI